MRNMFKITIFAAFAAVAGMSSILSGFGSAAMATPSLCDSIAGNLVANCGFETGDFTGWTPGWHSGVAGDRLRCAYRQFRRRFAVGRGGRHS